LVVDSWIAPAVDSFNEVKVSISDWPPPCIPAQMLYDFLQLMA
jgi:hypothetical protein